MSNDLLNKIIGNHDNLLWMKDNSFERLIFLTRHGSHAYGTNTPESDEDFRGVCIPPREYFVGFLNKFEQLVRSDPDAQIFDIRKFFTLAVQNNPNVLEILFTDEADHIHVTKVGQEMLSHREEFISKAAKQRFIGYTRQQAHRIKTHRRWLINPMKAPPTRTDMGLSEKPEISKQNKEVIYSRIRKQLDEWNVDFEPFSDAQKIYLNSKLSDILVEMKITSDPQWAAAARTLGLEEKFIQLLILEKEFDARKEEWNNYQHWLKTRNPIRAALEAKYGYDCYTEETEFLTDSGWKSFDDISGNDTLATVYVGNACNRTFMGIEYQKYTEKFDGAFTGNLYHLYGNHIDVKVTPNHNMLIKKEFREAPLNNIQHGWVLREAANLPDTFNVVRSITPKIKNYSDRGVFNFNTNLPDAAFLRLIGWYLADGSMAFAGDKPDDVRISQIKNGKLYASMKKFANKYKDKVPCSFYEYLRLPNDTHVEPFTEAILSVRGHIPSIIYTECNNVENKRIPRWAYRLSKNKMETLLDAMIMGDGTIVRPDNGIIYYSSLKTLADDVQELAFMCGFETSLYGPYKSVKLIGNKIYECDMYQVHINKTRTQFKRMVRSTNIKRIPVSDKRIVCFSVPNGVLVTRLNGHVGIHGNSKHGAHLVRLLRMGREILSEGKVIVKRPDREELLAIRNGLWSYDRLIDYADQMEKEITALYETSKLRTRPNTNRLDTLCQNLVLSFPFNKYEGHESKN